MITPHSSLWLHCKLTTYLVTQSYQLSHTVSSGFYLAKDFKVVSSVRHWLQSATFESCIALQAKPRGLATSQPASQLDHAETETKSFHQALNRATLTWLFRSLLSCSEQGPSGSSAKTLCSV